MSQIEMIYLSQKDVLEVGMKMAEVISSRRKGPP